MVCLQGFRIPIPSELIVGRRNYIHCLRKHTMSILRIVGTDRRSVVRGWWINTLNSVKRMAAKPSSPGGATDRVAHGKKTSLAMFLQPWDRSGFLIQPRGNHHCWNLKRNRGAVQPTLEMSIADLRGRTKAYPDMVCLFNVITRIQSELTGRGKNYVYGLRKHTMSIIENRENGPAVRWTGVMNQYIKLSKKDGCQAIKPLLLCHMGQTAGST